MDYLHFRLLEAVLTLFTVVLWAYIQPMEQMQVLACDQATDHMTKGTTTDKISIKHVNAVLLQLDAFKHPMTFYVSIAH